MPDAKDVLVQSNGKQASVVVMMLHGRGPLDRGATMLRKRLTHVLRVDAVPASFDRSTDLIAQDLDRRVTHVCRVESASGAGASKAFGPIGALIVRDLGK